MAVDKGWGGVILTGAVVESGEVGVVIRGGGEDS